MNVQRVLSAMPMFLVPMAVSRLRTSTPLRINSLSTVVLVKKMHRRHAGNLVEMMMIVVLVRLVIQVLPHAPTLTISEATTFSVDRVRYGNLFVHNKSNLHILSQIYIVFQTFVMHRTNADNHAQVDSTRNAHRAIDVFPIHLAMQIMLLGQRICSTLDFRRISRICSDNIMAQQNRQMGHMAWVCRVVCGCLACIILCSTSFVSLSILPI